jgi:HEAT repeat protein
MSMCWRMRSRSEVAFGGPIRLLVGMACAVMLGVAVWAARAASGDVVAPVPTSTPVQEKALSATWLTDHAEAARQSRLRNKPLLALAVMKNCPYCRALDQTLASAAVAARLEKFILYRFDIEADLDAASDLQVTAAPTLTLLMPNGIRVAQLEGATPAADLLAWLDEAEKKMSALGPDMQRKKPKDLAALLGAQDPLVREAATQLLQAQAESGSRAAVVAVAEAFAKGNLATRLGALELLRLWGAPLKDADPWKPETLPPTLDPLREWSEKADVAKSTVKPSPAEIEQDLQTWTGGEDNAKTRAAYERLARAGADLLPKVREMIPPTWDTRRERLTALRYRLLMSAALAAALPQAPFQMAARDADLRAQAVDAVAREGRIEGGGPELQGFFLEAFNDPDSKVREAALRGLRETGAGIAKAEVLRLLADPSPNVRAGILNDLARAPLPDLAKNLADYSAQESDEDLVVHAVRALREIRNKSVALGALVSLARHKSWRVRAEAVEALGPVSTSRRGSATIDSEGKKQVASALTTALGDEDAFVVGKAIEVVRESNDMDFSGALDALIAVTGKHPELALPALQAIAQNESLKRKAVEPLKKLCTNPSAEVRASALHVLAVSTRAPIAEEVLAGLADGDASVRSAAADSIRECLEYASRQSESEKPKSAASLVPEDTRKDFVAVLRKMISAEDAKERFAALQSLAVLGDTEIAFPGIVEMVAKDPALGAQAARLVPLLDWEKRKAVFDLLRQQPLPDEAWGGLFSGVFADAPESAEETLWEIFSNDPHVIVCPDSVLQGIVRFYGLQSGLWYADSRTESAQALTRLGTRAKAQLAAPHVRRRIMGLILLCRARRADGLAEAKAIVGKPASDAADQIELRRAAGELLLYGSGAESEALAVDALGSTDAEWRKSGMQFLASKHSLSHATPAVHVGDKSVWVQFLAPQNYVSSYKDSSRRTAWTPPKLPEKLTPALLRPFLEGDDPELRAGASYLLALLGDGAGLGNLIEAWRSAAEDEECRLMLARAIAAIGDDHNTKYVKEMYEGLSGEEKTSAGAQLYWTIRRIQGPEADRLRRAMRKDLGTNLMN